MTAAAPAAVSRISTHLPGTAAVRSIGASGQRDGISARSSVVLPLPRPPVSSKWRLPLARKERRIELAAGLYTGITVGLIPF